VAIEAIRRDPRFKNGEYERGEFKENGLDGLAIGRIAGHISYLSPDSMNSKFGRNYVNNDGLFELVLDGMRLRGIWSTNYKQFLQNSFDPIEYLIYWEGPSNYISNPKPGGD